MPINILFPYVYSPIPYSGSFSGKMVSLGPSRQDGKKNLSVRTSFNWLNYPGNSVDVNIQSQGSSPPIDQIKMVYIDNTTNSNNISLYFSDTQQFIECPSNSAAYIPVATGGLKCTVYNVQTSNSDNVGFNSNSNTDIFFYNFEVEGVFTTETQPSAATGTYANIISIISSGDNETVLGNAGLNRRNTIIGLNISVANIVVTTAGVLTVALAQGPIPISAQPAFQWQLYLDTTTPRDRVTTLMDMFGFSYPLGKVLNSPGLPWVLKTSFVGVISSGVVNVNTLYNQGY